MVDRVGNRPAPTQIDSFGETAPAELQKPTVGWSSQDTVQRAPPRDIQEVIYRGAIEEIKQTNSVTELADKGRQMDKDALKRLHDERMALLEKSLSTTALERWLGYAQKAGMALSIGSIAVGLIAALASLPITFWVGVGLGVGSVSQAAASGIGHIIRSKREDFERGISENDHISTLLNDSSRYQSDSSVRAFENQTGAVERAHKAQSSWNDVLSELIRLINSMVKRR